MGLWVLIDTLLFEIYWAREELASFMEHQKLRRDFKFHNKVIPLTSCLLTAQLFLWDLLKVLERSLDRVDFAQ